MFNFSNFNDTQMLYFLGSGLFLGALLVALYYLIRSYNRLQKPGAPKGGEKKVNNKDTERQ